MSVSAGAQRRIGAVELSCSGEVAHRYSRVAQVAVADRLMGDICIIDLGMAAPGAFVYRILSGPSVFDNRNGRFWDGRTSPDAVCDMAQNGNPTKLEGIYAIHLISEPLVAGRGHGHGMNLVLRDGNRINAADHTPEDGVRANAEKLPAFLAVPVWDAIIRKKRT